MAAQTHTAAVAAVFLIVACLASSCTADYENSQTIPTLAKDVEYVAGHIVDDFDEAFTKEFNMTFAEFYENARGLSRDAVINEAEVAPRRELRGRKPGPAPPVPRTKYSSTQVYEWYISHIKIRSKYFKGKVMTWNTYLAGYAQQWANAEAKIACGTRDVNGQFGTTLKYRPGNKWGENIFFGWYNAKDAYKPVDVANFWASQSQYYNYKSNSCAKGKYCGDFIQMVWKNSKSFGCGVATCPLQYKKGFTFKLVVCDYAPIGFTGGRPY
eukprot:jgi/Mesen1/7505/ME000039S06717